MEEVCERKNLVRAWQRVRGNKGAPGVGGMTIAGKAIELTWGGLRHVPFSELGKPQGDPTIAQESAEGIVGHAVGEASEALQAERRSNG